MALSPYSLVTLEEVKQHVGAGGDDRDGFLELVANRVTDEIESYLGRQIVKRTTDLTEYHTFESDGACVFTSELRTLERPIISVVTVHEDTATPRTYGAGALLAVNVGYEIVKSKGIIRRLDGGLGMPRSWANGHRAVRVVYTAGYADRESVPARIKGAALRYAALLWSESNRQDFGVSGQSDSLGNYTRFSAAMLTPELRSALDLERRLGFWESGERDE